MRVLLDMDGVLADFTGGISRAHGRPDPYDDPANHGRYAMADISGMTPSEFWAPAHQEDFWAELEPTSEAEVLVRHLTALYSEEYVCILSSPCAAHRSCMAASTGGWRGTSPSSGGGSSSVLGRNSVPPRTTSSSTTTT